MSHNTHPVIITLIGIAIGSLVLFMIPALILADDMMKILLK